MTFNNRSLSNFRFAKIVLAAALTIYVPLLPASEDSGQTETGNETTNSDLMTSSLVLDDGASFTLCSKDSCRVIGVSTIGRVSSAKPDE